MKKTAAPNVFVLFWHFFHLAGIRPTFFILSAVLSGIALVIHLVEIRLLMALLTCLLNPAASKSTGVLRLLPGPLPAGREGLPWLIAFLLLAVVVEVFFTFLANVGIDHQVRLAEQRLRECVFSRLLLFGKRYFDRTSIVRQQSVLLHYSQSVAQRFKALHQVLSKGLTVLAYLGVLFWLSWKMALAATLLIPVLMPAAAWLILRIKQAARKNMHDRRALDQQLFNLLTTIPLVQMENRQKEEEERFAIANRREAESAFQVQLKEEFATPIETLATFLLLFFLAMVAMRIFPAGDRSAVSVCLIFFLLVRRMASQLSAIGRMAVSVIRTAPAMEKLAELFEDRGKGIVCAGKKDFRGLQHGIELRNLTFFYGGKGAQEVEITPESKADKTATHRQPVLDQVSFTIEQGKVTALVGPTGSGKSTLFSLLMRLYPCPTGTIFFDGVDVRKFSLSSLRKKMACVWQGSMLVHDTIRHNLGVDNWPESKITELLQRTGLDALVKALPKGLDSCIGDRGVQLSGGQQQLIALVRMLTANAEILLLDEATSALDSLTEAHIQQVIAEAVQNRTAVVAAHRLSTIQHADHVIVLDHGRMVEQGTVEELRRQQGLFYQLWKQQRFD